MGTSGGDTLALAKLRNMPSLQERCTNTKNSYSGFKYFAHISHILYSVRCSNFQWSSKRMFSPQVGVFVVGGGGNGDQNCCGGARFCNCCFCCWCFYLFLFVFLLIALLLLFFCGSGAELCLLVVIVILSVLFLLVLCKVLVSLVEARFDCVCGFVFCPPIGVGW